MKILLHTSRLVFAHTSGGEKNGLRLFCLSINISEPTKHHARRNASLSAGSHPCLKKSDVGIILIDYKLNRALLNYFFYI